MPERTFDYRERIAELARRSTAWLLERRAELVREQRRLRIEELAVTAVLDERGVLDDATAARDGVSIDTVSPKRRDRAGVGVAARGRGGRVRRWFER